MSEHEEQRWGSDSPEVASRVTPESEAVPSRFVREALTLVDSHVNDYSAIFDKLGNWRLDEVAIFLNSLSDLQAYCFAATELSELELFAADVQEVESEGPIHSHYRAAYGWLRHKDRPWRLEVVSTSGHSPVHEAARGGLQETAPPGFSFAIWFHVSFKVPTLGGYVEAVDLLGQERFVLAQSCKSEYGRFSYFQVPPAKLKELGLGAHMYVKPRVNLRDA